MSDSVSAVLLAVGTELTTGQVINSNSAWLAGQLNQAGLENLLHWTMPDSRMLIREALEAAEQQTQLILVTGGLGPTSDDFTREVIAQWLGQELVFNQESWARLEERARNYGFKLGPSQRQQCWFPAEAQVFANPAGTADAFACCKGGLTLVALPGPPLEIKALWDSSVQAYLQPLFPERPALTLYRWQCLGIGEGNLGEIVEAALEGETGFMTGYRAHAPYIEVKLWIENSRESLPLLDKIEAAIGKWVVLREAEDAALRFLTALSAQSGSKAVRLIDGASEGLLTARLQQALQEQPLQNLSLRLETLWPAQGEPQQAMEWLADAQEPDELLLVLGPLKERQWSLGLYQGALRFESFELPWPGPRERGLRYLCEQALMLWTQWLTQPEPSDHEASL